VADVSAAIAAVIQGVADGLLPIEEGAIETRRCSYVPGPDAVAVAAVLLAELEGRPFSWIPAPDRELSEEAETACRLRLEELDTIASRLEDGDPGAAEPFQRDIERKRQAVLRRLEQERAGGDRQAVQIPDGPVTKDQAAVPETAIGSRRGPHPQ
jgi:hypothetical protein